MNQEDSEQNEVDGMKKGADSSGKVMQIYPIHNDDLMLTQIQSNPHDRSEAYIKQESCAIAKMTARCALYK